MLLAIIKGLTVTQGVLDSPVGLLLVVLSALRADTHVMGGRWQEARAQWQQLAQDTLGLLAGQRPAPPPPPSSKTSLTGMSGLPPPPRDPGSVAARAAAGSFVARPPQPVAAGPISQSN